jgi:murein DD-endopeptidase MepM/ murein hydrolase activator NlpD
MIYKTIATKPRQTLDQSLISIGGWLRSIDTQVISFIHSERRDWAIGDISIHQHQQNPDIPEWTYQRDGASRHQDKFSKGTKWYQHLGKSLAPWHTSRNWGSPLPRLTVNGSIGISASQGGAAVLSYAHEYATYPSLGSQKALNVRSHPFPSLQFPEGLGKFWATSYQLSTALAVLLPIAVNATQSPNVINFLAQASLPINSGAINTDLAIKAVAPITIEALVVKVPPSFSKPTGLIANIQSYTLPAQGEFTSGYGMRWGRLHKGIDIAAPIGTPIVAAAAGKVLTAGWAEDGFGNKVEIQHPDGSISLYAHTSRVLTRVGAVVHQGQLIAEMGSTGSSTGPHLHFQIHPGGKDAIDPMFFFARNKMLVAAKSDL